MNIATPADFDEVWNIFQNNKEWFPHVWNTKIRKRIELGQCVLQDGVVITFHQNNATRPIGRDTDVKVERDSYTIHQIVNSVKGNGNASKVMKEFFDWTGQDVYLTVRESILAANSFYKKIGMQPVGYINWSGGKMSGRVWKFKS